MLIDYFILLLTGIVTSMVGAFPFGLVNLTVLNVSFEQGNRVALKIAYGASFVEVLFGLTAILAGGLVYQHIEGNAIISYFIVAVLSIAGLFFIIKKQRISNSRETGYSGVFKGAFLNLISIQVFLFWILAIAFISSKQLLPHTVLSVLVFITGIWLGKMTVLLLYMNLSKKIFSSSRIISKNINIIIGIILFGVAFVHALKI